MRGLRVTENELRDLVVGQLELIDAVEFERSRQMAMRLRVPLERTLVERSRIPMAFLLEHLAQAWGIEYMDLQITDVKPEALEVLGEEYARRHVLVPFAFGDGTLQIAMADPRDGRVIDEIERTTKRRVVPFLAPEAAIMRALLLYKGDLRAILERTAVQETLRVVKKTHTAAEQSATDLVDRILEYAVVTRASDIHIEPYELETLVRYRVDGVLQDVLSLPPATLASLTARIKVLSGLRIDERRMAQDGRFEANLGGYRIDLRVATLPTLWGEKIVLRVLSRDATLIDLDDLGLAAPDYAIVLRNIARPFGMILIAGPTGCGKTTSLYAMLIRIGVERQNVVNISTVEDPIEYTLPRVSQVAVNPTAGIGFAAGLRALLRQDPDIIMVGEIRDQETAEIAVRAALVGRLLISTVHTNDATGVVPRLLDMGIEPYLVASTLVLALGQRLVRRVCTTCRESYTPDSVALDALRARPNFDHVVDVLRGTGVLGGTADPLAGVRFFRGRGCAQCNGSGFRGRLGVFELFEVDDRIRAMIMERRDAGAIRSEAIRRGMRTMFEDGLAKVLLGDTTPDEVLRVAL